MKQARVDFVKLDVTVIMRFRICTDFLNKRTDTCVYNGLPKFDAIELLIFVCSGIILLQKHLILLYLVMLFQ